MAVRHYIPKSSPMASPWRRQRTCILVSSRPALAVLRRISAREAFIETSARPDLGSVVQLHHPKAGAISGTVSSITQDGIAVRFDYGEASVGFALAAIVSDMTRDQA